MTALRIRGFITNVSMLTHMFMTLAMMVWCRVFVCWQSFNELRRLFFCLSMRAGRLCRVKE